MERSLGRGGLWRNIGSDRWRAPGPGCTSRDGGRDLRCGNQYPHQLVDRIVVAEKRRATRSKEQRASDKPFATGGSDRSTGRLTTTSADDLAGRAYHSDARSTPVFYHWRRRNKRGVKKGRAQSSDGSVSNTSKRYPTPRTVRRYTGLLGLSSMASRTQRMCTSRVRVSPR